MKDSKANLPVYFWTAASAGCMLVIFLFSMQPAEQSSQVSGSVAQSTVGTVVGWFQPEGQDVPAAFMGIVETVIRKLAHLGIYMTLGFCVVNAVRGIVDRNAYMISLIWCSLYAASDEIHQYYVPGRAGMWQDWLLDTVGALLGIAVVAMYVKRKKRSRTPQVILINKRNEQKL